MDLLAIGAGLEFNEFPSGVFRSLIALSDGIASLKLRNGSVLGEQSDVYLIGKAFSGFFRIGKVRRHPGAVGDNSGFLVEEMVSGGSVVRTDSIRQGIILQHRPDHIIRFGHKGLVIVLNIAVDVHELVAFLAAGADDRGKNQVRCPAVLAGHAGKGSGTNARGFQGFQIAHPLVPGSSGCNTGLLKHFLVVEIADRLTAVGNIVKPAVFPVASELQGVLAKLLRILRVSFHIGVHVHGDAILHRQL